MNLEPYIPSFALRKELPKNDVHADRVVVVQPDSSIDVDIMTVPITFAELYTSASDGDVTKVPKSRIIYFLKPTKRL